MPPELVTVDGEVVAEVWQGKITSGSIRADVVRKLDRGEPESEVDSAGSGRPPPRSGLSDICFGYYVLVPYCCGCAGGGAAPPICVPITSPEIMISTRRFCWRPSFVSLLATGLDFPKPAAVIAEGSIPC